MKEILKAENLRKTFRLSRKQQKLELTAEPIKVAVDNLSFSAYEGEIFGLLGPNGAGKTTTLRMLAFLTNELKLEDFFTPNYLFDFFSELYGVEKSAAEQRKRMLFAKFGIDRFAEVKLANLSTGMKQKVSLVISIVHDPAFIIFDEPTNGLDVLTAKVVTDFLLELKAEGKTIILSTHIFSLVEKLCDRVGVIINGKLVALDTLANLTAEKNLEDKFFDLYKQTVGDAL